MTDSNSIKMFEEYFDYMDDMTPEQFCQFMRLIRNLRFKYIDTNPSDGEDKMVRMAWRCVRPSVLKSRTNAEEYEARKKKKQDEDVKTVEDDFNPEFSNEVRF